MFLAGSHSQKASGCLFFLVGELEELSNNGYLGKKIKKLLEMNHRNDVRWVQRLNNYNKALEKLNKMIDYVEEERESKGILEEMLKQAIIQSFEYTHELAWNVMKDYAKYQGNDNVGGPRDAIREALQLQLIDDGDSWMEMIRSHNKTSHTYNEQVANQIFKKILEQYQANFQSFQQTMEEKRAAEQ